VRTEDGYIINKCLNGNSAAFGFLVDKYKAAVYAFAYAELRNFHDAEDVTQEVFIKAYQKLRTLRRWDNFLAWLYSITSNLCKMWVRAQSRRPDREFIEDQDPETLEEPSIDPHRENQVFELLHEALDSLPKAYRQVLTLYYLGGMNSVEIARFLGTSPTAIRQRLTRARAQLKEGMLAMMSQTFEGRRLQASFTFRIVEAVKRVKIQPMPRMTGLPWGLSLAAGIILAVMSLGSHVRLLNPMASPMSSSLPSEMKVLKTGEIPVDVLRISQMPFISSKQGDGDVGESELPHLQNALFLAPWGKEGEWIRKADMPTARFGLGTSVVNGKIYTIGGAANEQQALSSVEEYDPAVNTWTEKADMPTARFIPGCTSVVNGKIYAIGGAVHGLVPLQVVEEYDPAKDEWRKRANMPTARMFLSTCAVNGKIYAIGGTSGVVAVSTVEEYDPATDTWTRKANMPTARNGLSTCAVDGRIYAIGGQAPGWGPNAGGGFLSTVEEYNPVTDTWAENANMPSERCSFGVCVVNGKIYAISGIGFPVFSAVEEYDPAADTWTKKPDIPNKRWSLSAASVNGKIYAIGGSTSAPIGIGTSIVEEYDTGFIPKKPKGVGSKGKLATTWGEEKRRGDGATR